MRSATSSSEPRGLFCLALFRKNLGRFWPLWAFYGLSWFFALPLGVLLQERRPVAMLRALFQERIDECILAAPAVAVAYGILLAMVLFSYLMNNRSTGMVHVLPLRREGIFLTAYASAAAAIAAPTLAVALITLAAQAAKGAVLAGGVFKWFGVNLIFTLFFFSLGVFCAMFTGHILALPVFYGILNALVIGICFLLDAACETLLVGFDGWNLSDSPFARWCTPAYQIYHLLIQNREVQETYLYDDMASSSTTTLIHVKVMPAVCYALVLFCFLTFLALVAYHRRHLERSGDVVSVGWVRPVFQYGVGACVGLALGSFLYYLFFLNYGPWAYVIAVALSAFLGAFLARMLLKKSVRVFGDWKGPALCALCMLILLSGIRLDLPGFQRWVPALDRVASVSIGVHATHPDDAAEYVKYKADAQQDPQLCQAILDLHRELVSDLSWLEKNEGNWYYEGDGDGYQTSGSVELWLNYTLRDGRLVHRQYTLPFAAEDLARSGSWAVLLQEFLNRPQVVESAYLGESQVRGVTSVRIESLAPDLLQPQETTSVTAELRDSGSAELTGQEAQILWEAFAEDLAAGRVRRYLLNDRERMENSYYFTNLVFYLTGPYSTTRGDYDRYTVMVTPERSETALMTAMERLGLRDCLVAWGDMQ